MVQCADGQKCQDLARVKSGFRIFIQSSHMDVKDPTIWAIVHFFSQAKSRKLLWNQIIQDMNWQIWDAGIRGNSFTCYTTTLTFKHSNTSIMYNQCYHPRHLTLPAMLFQFPLFWFQSYLAPRNSTLRCKRKYPIYYAWAFHPPSIERSHFAPVIPSNSDIRWSLHSERCHSNYSCQNSEYYTHLSCWVIIMLLILHLRIVFLKHLNLVLSILYLSAIVLYVSKT